MLLRTLEPELMDTAEDAHEYDAMDHSAVNAVFVTDLLNVLKEHAHTSARSLQRPGDSGPQSFTILDLGAGTAQILIELARRAPHMHITAVDAAENMLALARQNIAVAQQTPLPFWEGQGEGSLGTLASRIELVLADAKTLPFADATFDAVISNCIIHHIPEPRAVIAEAIRVTRPGGLLFHRDLARPNDKSELQHLVDTYAAGCTSYQRRLYAESLHAALTAGEMAQLVTSFGFPAESVRMTSDRHWTWCAVRM